MVYIDSGDTGCVKKRKKTIAMRMWIVDWVWYGEHVVFLGGGFSSVSASESECQQIRRFSIDSHV